MLCSHGHKTGSLDLTAAVAGYLANQCELKIMKRTAGLLLKIPLFRRRTRPGGEQQKVEVL